MSREPPRAGFLRPGRVTLGAHFGRLNGNPQSARGSSLKTISIVAATNGRTQGLHYQALAVDPFVPLRR